MTPRGIHIFLLLTVLTGAFARWPEVSRAVDGATENGAVYYIRLDQKSRNGTYVTDALTMVPADEDYRRSAFRKMSVSGQILAASITDPLSAARNDAYERLLIQEGTKSIRSKTRRDTGSSLEESVVSYEGYVLTPHTVTSQEYSKDGTVFTVTMDVDFAPMALPPEWSFRYVRKKIGDAFDYFLSLFH